MFTRIFQFSSSILNSCFSLLPSMIPRATFKGLPTMAHGKTQVYKLQLKAKRRRMRRGKTGGPPKGVDTFRTFVGKTREISFLKPKKGFPTELLNKFDPQKMIKLSDITFNQSLK
ncbi:hypothetical protein HMI56_003881 [Coelomomyces lativittatus]|nr:hypothetical protein HMI56_003881 [Coelomomyces lativittatus]